MSVDPLTIIGLMIRATGKWYTPRDKEEFRNYHQENNQSKIQSDKINVIQTVDRIVIGLKPIIGVRSPSFLPWLY